MDTKICNRCDSEKLISEFATSAKRGTQAYCRECQKKYDRQYYVDNRNDKKEKIRAYSQRQRLDATEFVLKVKTCGCCFCSEREPLCLEFHHLFGKKEFNIGDVRNGGYSIPRIKKEIEKCILVCANCHRKIHAGLITPIGEWGSLVVPA